MKLEGMKLNFPSCFYIVFKFSFNEIDFVMLEFVLCIRFVVYIKLNNVRRKQLDFPMLEATNMEEIQRCKTELT